MRSIIVIILNDLTWGQFLFSKVQFALMLVLTLKTFKLSSLVSILAGVIALVISIIAGHVFDKYFKEDYHRRYYGNFSFKEDNMKKT